jgi:hypothetical protein
MKASYGSHSDEEGQAFVRPAFPHARPSAATMSRRVAVGTAIAVLSAAAATAAYVAFVEPPETDALQQTPMTTQLQASTLLESLMADVGPTAFDALDVDGDGIVTKSEYLGRLTEHRDDVLSKLQHSNLDETVKQPIAEILQETYDHEAACVASVFEMVKLCGGTRGGSIDKTDGRGWQWAEWRPRRGQGHVRVCASAHCVAVQEGINERRRRRRRGSDHATTV